MLILPTDFESMPWKNGAGTTLEIFRGRGLMRSDEWTWRLSMARLDGASDFSRFDGIDRILTFLGPGSMNLSVEGKPHHLTSLDFLAFPGDVEASAGVSAPPAWDLNLMGRRDAVTLSVRIVTSAVEIPTHSNRVVGVFGAYGSAQLDQLTVPIDGVGLTNGSGMPSTRIIPLDGAVIAFTVTEIGR